MDSGRADPPDPGGQACQREEASPQQSGSLMLGITQNQNQTPPAAGRSSVPPRQPKTGKQERASAAGSQQPGSAPAFTLQGMDSALPRAPTASRQELVARLRQRQLEKDAEARAASTSGDERAAPESGPGGESQVVKRPRTAPPAHGFPFKAIVPFPPSRSMVWFDFGAPGKPLFGSIHKAPGISVRANVHAGRMGDPSISLSMSVNKDDISKPLSSVEDEISRFELVWEPYTLTEEGYRVHAFNYTDLEVNQNALTDVPDAHAEIMDLTKGKLTQLVCVDMQVMGCRVSMPFEAEYWKPLENSRSLAQRRLFMSAGILDALASSGGSHMHIKFWFRAPCVFSEWERTCASLFKQCVDQRRPYLHQYGVRQPLLDLDQSLTFHQVGDGMYLTGKDQGGSKVLGQTVHLFQPALSFPTADAAMTVYGLCPIRAAQNIKGLGIFLNYQEWHVFLMPMPTLAFVKTVMGEVHRPKHEDDPRTLLETSFRAFIRIPNVGGIKDDGVLVPGLRLTLEFSNEAYFGEGDVVREHRPNKKGQHYFGTIISPSTAELHVSGTTFAANLTKRRGAKPPQQSCIHKQLQYLPNKDLVKAQIQVNPDFNTQKQELQAVKKVWRDETEFVKTLRDKIWKEQGQLPEPKMVDLMRPDDSMFDFEGHVRSLGTGNHPRWSSDQQRGLRGLTHAPDGISIVQGPPGTGKTFVLVEAVACLLRCNRKVQVVGPTNTSVDNVCSKIFERVQRWPELEDKIVLRLEVPSVMEIDVLQQGLNEGESGYTDEIWQNPEFKQAIVHFLEQQLEEDNTEILAKLDEAEQEYKDLASKRRPERDCPTQTTMGYNIRKLEYLDFLDVLKELNPAVPLPKFEEVNADHYCAAEKSKSYAYSKLARQIRQTRGRPTGKTATQWKQARLAQIARVLKSASCVVMTPHVSGQLVNLTGFQADIVLVEEGGVMSVHSTMVPVAANSGTVKGLVLIGDHKQLRPALIEGNHNEWGHNARLSLEELLLRKAYPSTMLTTSYRFHQELCSFPSKQFYDNRLQSDPYADQNHPSRVAARQISKELGIKRTLGCEYVVVNTLHGVARREINGGTSFQNFATANAVVRVLRKFVVKGIPASDITILNLYKGQHGITQTKILAKNNGATHFERLGGLSTIDAFQGKQSSIVLLDLVAAKEMQGGPRSQNMDPDIALGSKELISRFAQEKNRLNLAITRAKHALFVFCHGPSIKDTSKVVREQEQSCLVNLWNDARDRGIIAQDKSPDDHPEAVAQQDSAKAPLKKIHRK